MVKVTISRLIELREAARKVKDAVAQAQLGDPVFRSADLVFDFFDVVISGTEVAIKA